jgi:hypothetical protein
MNPGNLFRAARGPILLITIGSLFALDHFGVVGFDRTWPLLIIMFGILKLLERLGGATYPQYPGPPPPGVYPPSPGGMNPPPPGTVSGAPTGVNR